MSDRETKLRLLRIENLVLHALLQLAEVLTNQRQASKTMAQIDDELEALRTDVSAEGEVVTAAVTLLNGIAGQINAAVQQALAAGATPQQLQAVSDASTAINQQTQALGMAVAANTAAASGGDSGGGTSGGTTGGGTTDPSTGGSPDASRSGRR